MDIEKVIKGLENCLHYKGHCLDCPYNSPNCQNDVLKDAVALLKEQEAIEPVCKIFFDIPYYFCGQCNEMLNMYSTKAMFCSKCGHPVKWGAVK